MKALKLSSNVDEKKELKARCGALIDTADRIKNSDEWTPSVDPNTKEAQIGRWAASIDPRYSPGPAYQEVGSVWPDPSPHQSTLEHTLQSRRPGDFSSASGKSPVSSVSFPSRTQQLYAERTGSTLYRDDSRHTSMPLIRCTKTAGKHLLIRNTKAIKMSVTIVCWTLGLRQRQPKVRFRHCHGLTTSGQSQQLMTLLRWHWRGPEPRSLCLPRTSIDSLSRYPQESSRERKTSSCSRHRSSMASSVHLGTRLQQQQISFRRTAKSFFSTCAPMPPRQCLTKVARDARDLSLSSYQQQFFQGWVRAHDAVPPPALYPNGRDGVGPLMSSSRSIDLVQDAASDCSVVASLCAGVARAERGHDQVRGSFSIPGFALTNALCRCSKISFTHSTGIWGGPSRRPTANTSFVSTSTVAGGRS
jgi:calpain-7